MRVRVSNALRIVSIWDHSHLKIARSNQVWMSLLPLNCLNLIQPTDLGPNCRHNKVPLGKYKRLKKCKGILGIQYRANERCFSFLKTMM